MMFPAFSFCALYVCVIFLVEVEGIKVLKADLNSSLDSSAEILNSSLSLYSEFTLCGRVFNDQFSSSQQTILYLKFDDSMIIGLGTSPGFPCDEAWQGILYLYLYYVYLISITI